MAKGANNFRVIVDDDTPRTTVRGVRMVSVFGTTLPERVWRETAEAMGALNAGKVDDVLLYTRGSKIKVAPLKITKPSRQK